MRSRTISTVEFIRHFGRYHDEAQRAPLTLTKHGRPSVVVLSAEAFEKLTSQDDPRRAYAMGETPPGLARRLLDELDRQSAEYESGADD
ncbi:MAG TPA: type II toxin-antitoxin system Phd/YefM family antitoxin [Mesorhizobium sp.]|jgi:prevent-host-death family protein